MSETISFVASVAKVQTLVDGGIRVTFDMSEGDTMQMAQLAECKRFGVALQVIATPDKQGRSRNVEQMATGPKRKSGWTPARE